MKKAIQIFFFILSCSVLYSQTINYKLKSQTNPNISFENFLSGITYVKVQLSDDVQKDVDGGKSFPVLEDTYKYLQTLGFGNILITQEQMSHAIKTTPCLSEIAILNFYSEPVQKTNPITGYTSWHLINCGMQFISLTPTHDDWTFESDEKYKTAYEAMTSMYGYKKPAFNPQNRMKLKSNLTDWNENKIKSYLDGVNNSFEGIYENITTDDNNPKYKIALLKKDDNNYEIIYLSGATNYDDWKEGEIKATLEKTAYNGLYKTKWYKMDKRINEDVYTTKDEQGLLNITFNNIKESDKCKYPIFPTRLN
jgi:hypothetical protein